MSYLRCLFSAQLEWSSANRALKASQVCFYGVSMKCTGATGDNQGKLSKGMIYCLHARLKCTEFPPISVAAVTFHAIKDRMFCYHFHFSMMWLNEVYLQQGQRVVIKATKKDLI